METSLIRRWFAPAVDAPPERSYLRARWIWLRALGVIFFSAFYSLYFQIHGLIGPRGILPATLYFDAVREALGNARFWLVPSLLWLGTSDVALTVLVWAGLLASIALTLNLWPRAAIAVSFVAFLSFVSAAQEFSGYQSDGMLLEAALVSFFFAPHGFRPGLAADRPPSRAAHFLLLWEWFRIYFESGVVKLLSGEPQWRDLTAMDKYYENGPLPTWLGWYVHHWPHGFHAFTAGATLFVELVLCWLVFFPKRSRVVACAIVTPLQIGIILTANYAFLNYLVLFLGVLLLDDRVLRVPERLRRRFGREERAAASTDAADVSTDTALVPPAVVDVSTHGVIDAPPDGADVPPPAELPRPRVSIAQTVLFPILFVTSICAVFLPAIPLVPLLAPFRVANTYGLFAVMTRERNEIEFEGTSDGLTWKVYPFRYKPQALGEPPRIFAPYQPRFEWNLWFASLSTYEQNPWVLNTQARLMENSPPVLRLFRTNPFPNELPLAVRAVAYQYWFTSPEERRKTGRWWKRELRGRYGPAAVRNPDGSVTFR